VFMSGHQMYELGQIPCRAEDFSGGACTNLNDHPVGCTNRADSCRNTDEVVSRKTCTLHTDKANPRRTHLFRTLSERRRVGAVVCLVLQ